MATAFDRGVSSFYWNSGPAHDAFRDGLRELAQSAHRESLFVIANGGSPSRGAGDHRQAERVLEDFALAKRELGVGYIDLFVLQYIQPYEESETVLATLDALCANRPQTALLPARVAGLRSFAPAGVRNFISGGGCGGLVGSICPRRGQGRGGLVGWSRTWPVLGGP